MSSTDSAARGAGILYLIMGLTAVFSYEYVPHTLFMHANATTAANNIVAHQMLFRISIVSELISVTAFLFLVRALYGLLKGVDKKHASLMVTLVLVSIPISFLNVLNEIAVLLLLRGPDFLSVFDKPQLEGMALLFIRLHGQGLFVAQIFWGLWLFPFGVLVMKSGFIPRFMGVLLILGCFTYIIVSLTWLLLPDYLSAVNQFATLPEAAAELPILLWLLIKGPKLQPLAATA